MATKPGPWGELPPAMPVADPDARIVFGMLLGCVAVFGWFAAGLTRVSYWMVLLAGCAIAMIASGAAQLRREARIRAEVARAEREWPDLVCEAEAALRAGGGIPRMLQGRGYRDFFVRRWITRRLAAELAGVPRAR